MPEPAVLLISPGILRWTDRDFGLPHLVALGGYLRQQTGVRVEILDLNYEPGDHRDLARRLEGLGPFLLIGVSAYSSFDYRRIMALGHFLSGLYPDVPRVAGGYHASALPQDLVYDGSPYTAVVVGEGERPVADMVRTLLGGGRLERAVWGPDLEPDINALPPYAWDLLGHYWPQATRLGRKLQIYLSRGCPYHCTFCMERAKSGYAWRAYTPDRALDELQRLSTYTDLRQWVVNLADPLFGFRRGWRREVLDGIARRGLLPRQYWTLTRSDDLDEDDVGLLGRARFSIGIGLESGSPTMLKTMMKVGNPDRYLAAILRLSRLAGRHGLRWAVNVIIGHPGETPETLAETRAFLGELFSAEQLTGWLSVDPFRLYPGAQVHEQMADWERTHGARFYHKTWWKSWYDTGFLAEHNDPSRSLDFEGRVRYMYQHYPPLVQQIQQRFQSKGEDIDRVYESSLAEQVDLLRPERVEGLLARARQSQHPTQEAPELRVPIGLHVRDPWVRRREEAVRRLLDTGALQDEAVIEALLAVGPERFMDEADAGAILADRTPAREAEGEPAPGLALGLVALGLQVLAPQPGERAADLAAGSGYVSALLAELVGPRGQVVVAATAQAAALATALRPWPQVEVRAQPVGRSTRARGVWDAIWLGAALPRIPGSLGDQVEDGGRVFTSLGPRFRAQDLVLLTRVDGAWQERRLGRARLPVLAGVDGWIPAPQVADPGTVTLQRWPAPALAMEVLARLDLGRDAANLYNPQLGARPWAAELRQRYDAAEGRLQLHALVLRHREVPRLLDALERPPAPLADPAGMQLCQSFAMAITQEHPTFRARWQEAPPAEADALCAQLRALRDQMWASQSAAPPPIRLLDCPALGRHGRATRDGATRVIAIALDAGLEHALLQALHELMHGITDPLVPGDGIQDTRVASAGYARHAHLEAVAVAATDAFLRAKAPQHVPGFERWVAGLLA